MPPNTSHAAAFPEFVQAIAFAMRLCLLKLLWSLASSQQVEASKTDTKTQAFTNFPMTRNANVSILPVPWWLAINNGVVYAAVTARLYSVNIT
jgi:hypothetical protein